MKPSRILAFVIISSALAALIIPATNQTAQASTSVIIPVGKVALNSDNGNLYIATGSGDSVTVIDPVTATIVDSIEVPPTPAGEPEGITYNPDNGNMYVSTYFTITVIDGNNNIISSSTLDQPPGQDYALGNLVYNPVDGYLYVLGGYTDSIIVVDIQTETIAASLIPLLEPGTSIGMPTGIVVNSDNGKIYIGNFGPETVTVLDVETHTVIGDPIQVGFAHLGPRPMAYNPLNGNLYVGNPHDRTVMIIDGTSDAIIGDPIGVLGITVPPLDMPRHISVNPENGDVYVISDQNVLTVIDMATGTVKGGPLYLGASPVAIGVKDTGELYAINYHEGVVSVTDPPTMPATKTVVNFSSHSHTEYFGYVRVFDDIISGCYGGVFGEATKQDGGVHGSWGSMVPERGLLLTDFGVFQEMETDGQTFELRGVRTGADDGEMMLICAGEPVTNNVTPVVVTGECGPDSEMAFRVGDNIEMIFIGDSLCYMPLTFEKVQLAVNSVDLSGKPVNGMWTVIRSMDGSVLKTGFTPLAFEVISGTDYKVSVANYDGKVFQQWDDGSTSKVRTVSLTSDATLTATYDTGDTLRGFTSLTYTGAEERPDLTVNAVSLDGKTLGMWAIIDPQSTDESGTTFKVYVHNYQDRIFDRWEDGSSGKVRTLTISEDTTITAHYNTG
jgi:DNA-binding beta-propeller fold protein YncE